MPCNPSGLTARTDGGADLRELLPAPMNDARVAVVEDDTDMAELLRTELGQYFHILIYMYAKIKDSARITAGNRKSYLGTAW